MAEGSLPLDWGTAEALAFGSLLLEGTPVRAQRPGLRPRHLLAAPRRALRHRDRGRWTPLATWLRSRRRSRSVDSPLSEMRRARLRVRLQRRLARGARAVGGPVRRLRQRRAGHHRPVHRVGARTSGARSRPGAAAAARVRGAGPRALERAHRAVPAALRRRQHSGLQPDDAGAVLPPAAAADAAAGRRKPLVVFTPKSLLRLPAVGLAARGAHRGRFRVVLDDAEVRDRAAVDARRSCAAARCSTT